MKKHILKSILSLVLALTLVLGTASPAFAAETSDSITGDKLNISYSEANSVAKKLTLNTTKTDSLKTADGQNWYKFTTSQRGYFQLNFRINEATDFNAIEEGWDIYIYNANDLSSPIKTITDIETHTTFPILPMAAGNYFIMVCCNSSYYDCAGCLYDMTVNFTKSNVWEVENNDTNTKANAIKVNTTYYGSTYYSEDKDWYKVSVSENGYLKLALGIDSRTDVSEIEDGWAVSIYDANYELLKTCSNITSSTTLNHLPLSKGTYYILVEADSTYYTPLDGIYTLKLNFKESTIWETEKNESNATADTIKSGTVYNGTIYTENDVDWYKVKTTQTGYFKVNLALDPSVDINSVHDGWTVSVYDSNLNEIITYTDIKSNFSTPVLPYAKGTYYVRVSADYAYNAPIDCVYQLSVTETKKSTWESEGNNSRTIADKMSLNKTYSGILTTSSDEDWFKLTVKATGKVKLTFAKDESVNIDNVHDGWDVYIYPKDSTEPVCTLDRITATGSTETTLNKGTYYVKVCPNYIYNAPVECIYNVKVAYAKTPAKAAIASATGGKKQVVLKWKEVEGATGYIIYRSTSKNGTYKKVKTIKGGDTIKYTDKKLKSKTKYYYKIVAYNSSNGVTSYATEAAIKAAKTK